MTQRAEMIKAAMQAELAKEGKTLQDLEASLGMEKGAAASITNLGTWLDIAKSLGTIGVSSAIGAGALAGTGAYAGYLANEDSSNQKMKRFQERQQYIDATEALKEKMHHPTTM